ncbi:MAG: sortase, partial [bacterium]|nr:sortase [bacterium]
NGVAHYNGTAKPGEGSNVFIFGHSSFFEADPGKFKEIFKELNLLEKNDEIIAWNNNKKYKYKVTEKKIIEPNETQYLLPTSSEQLTLMTCYPIGSTAQRLIVIAKP